MCCKGGAGATRGVADFPGNEQGGGKCIRQTARMGLGGPRRLNHPTWFYALGLSKGGCKGSFIYLLSSNIILEYLTDPRKQMAFALNSFHLLQIKALSWLSQATPGSQASHLLRSPLLSTSPRRRFSLIDILALETRSWLLSHFRISFWGSWNTCPLIACHSASGPGWQARLLWLMMWLMDKIRKNIQKNISVWSGVSASLHQVAAEGIFCCMPHYTVMAFPGKAVSFHDTRQQAALWALGPPSPEEGAALKSGHFQKCLKLLFCCHEFNMNQHNMKWAWGILVTSDFLRLLSKQPSRRKGRVALSHFLSPNLLQKRSHLSILLH